MTNKDQNPLRRIADALDRLAPNPLSALDLGAADAFMWRSEPAGVIPVEVIARQPLELLLGIDRAKDILLSNTRHFAAGLSANNALLWGARGMGKSSLIKAVHGTVTDIKLIEIAREDLSSIGQLLELLRDCGEKILLFCDDLSFDSNDAAYKSLKAVLDGGVAGRPNNVLFYATSNRRHLMPRDMIENERGSAINPSEAVEEKVSLSDRFGLWLGFHPCDQEQFLAMIAAYCAHYGVDVPAQQRQAEAIEWQATRGARSGRVAWQYFMDLAARQGVHLSRP